MVTDSQVRLLRRKLMQGKTLVAAAAAAGMSERTARTWKEGLLPSATRKPRQWRTRPDPFAEVWQSELVPLLERDEERVLEAQTLLGELEKRRPGCFSALQLRTLQRRVREWRALHGPEREVFFPQEHVPGRECAFDFTHGKELGVRVCGEPFDHLLFELVLSFSGWTWACLAYGETFEALSMGLQGALWDLGVSFRRRAAQRSCNPRRREFRPTSAPTSAETPPGRSTACAAPARPCNTAARSSRQLRPAALTGGPGRDGAECALFAGSIPASRSVHPPPLPIPNARARGSLVAATLRNALWIQPFRAGFDVCCVPSF
jgi:hypothetical protein